MGSCPWFYKQPNLVSFKACFLHHRVGKISDPGLLDGPGQIEHADKGANLRNIKTLPAHAGGYKGGRKTKRNAFSDIDSAKSEKPTVAG